MFAVNPPLQSIMRASCHAMVHACIHRGDATTFSGLTVTRSCPVKPPLGPAKKKVPLGRRCLRAPLAPLAGGPFNGRGPISMEAIRTLCNPHPWEEDPAVFASALGPVSYTHLTLPTIYSV